MNVKDNIIYEDSKAIDWLKHTVVDASAGTGKTYTICEKIIRRLKLGYNIREFVIITYTEKAAGELVDRIRKRISTELKETITPDEKDRLENALNNFDFATINTIHGFCQSILKEYAFECGLLNNLNLNNSNNLNSIAFTESVFTDFINEEYPNIDNEEILKLFKNNNNKLSDYTLNSKVKIFNDKFFTELPSNFIEDKDNFLNEFTNSFTEFLNTYDKLIIDLGLNIPKSNLKTPNSKSIFYKFISNNYNVNLAQFKKISKDKLQKEYLDFIDNQLEIRNELEKEFDHRLTLYEDFYNECEFNNYDISKIIKNVNLDKYKDVLSYFDSFKNYIKNLKKRDHLIKTIQKYNQLKQANNIIDFSDMIKLVTNALTNNENLIKTLQNKWSVGIIDEFQDTTPMQYYIAKKLFLDRIVDEKENKPSHLIIVGDEKQSIYSFQGANVETYRSAKNEMLGYENLKENNLSYKIFYPYNAKYEPLNDNYRTNKDLLDLMNQIFSNNILIKDYKNVNYKKEDTIDFPLTIHKYKITDEPNKFNNLNNVKEDYAYKIGKSIIDTIKTHNEKCNNEKNKISFKNFCVLFRYNKDAIYLAKAFNNLSIKFTHYKKEGLYNSFEAKEILLLLKALSYPSKKHYIKSLFATDFFSDFKLEELNNNENIYIEIENKLEKWRQTFYRKNIYSMFKEIFKDTNVFERLLIDKDDYNDTLYEVRSGERNITNLYHIAKKLNEYERYNNLVDYVNKFIEYKEIANREENLEELDTENNTVKIMTMHSSKGLEFKHVFIFGGWYDSKANSPYKIVTKTNKEFYFTDSNSDISSKYKTQELEEFKRLLYVAITRAKETLYLPYIYNTIKSSNKINKYKSGSDLILTQAIEEIVDNTSLKNVKCINVLEKEKSITSTKTKTITDYEKLYDTVIDKDIIDYEQLKIDKSDNIRNKKDFTIDYHNKKREIKSFSSLRKEDISKARKFGLDLDEKIEVSDEIVKGEVTVDDYEENETTILGGKEIGNLIHSILETIDFKQIKTHTETKFIEWFIKEAKIEKSNLYKLLSKYSEIEIEKIASIIFYTLNTDLVSGFKIKDIDNSLKEIKFNMALKNNNENFYLNGAIDMIFELDNKIYILDWKTNKTKTGKYEQKDLENLMNEHYNNQYKIYVEAVNKYLEENNCPIKEVSGIFYVFLRPCERGKNAGIFYKEI